MKQQSIVFPRKQHAELGTVESCDPGPGDVRVETTISLVNIGVYDMTGHWAVMPMALELAKRFGKVMLIGDTPEPAKQHLTQDVLARWQ